MLECEAIPIRRVSCRAGAESKPDSAEVGKLSALLRTAPGESGRESMAVCDVVCAIATGIGAASKPSASRKIDSRAMKDFEIRSLFKRNNLEVFRFSATCRE
jgi:hypothetical protein